MSKKDNIELHKQVVAEAKKLPPGSNKRLQLIHRSITGILRAYSLQYNPIHI